MNTFTCQTLASPITLTMGCDFTIAIPVYNGAKRLPLVLDRILAQTGVTGLSWEVIVIDNNSTDETAAIVRDYQGRWPLAAPLRYALERRQGAGFARQLAIQEANADLIGFLDDDNLPEPNWLAMAYAFAQTHPQAGAYGSQIHGLYEVPLPDNFERIVPFLAITERGDQPLLYEARKLILPPSAGLVVRRDAWLNSVPDCLTLNGRTTTSMLTGEDTEALAHIRNAGWEVWYNPAMEIHHQIPQHRLEQDYLIPFFQGIGLSRYVVRMANLKPWMRPLGTLLYVVNDLRKLVVHLLRHGMKVKSDLVAACEMTLIWHSLISPLYILQKCMNTNQNH